MMPSAGGLTQSPSLRRGITIMKTGKILPLLLAGMCAVAAAAPAGLQGRKGPSPDAASPALEKAKEDFYTVADYDAREPADARKRELRRARAKHWNLEPQKGVDPRRFMITEERESSFGGPPSHAPVEPALPAAQSDAVIIGEVTDAEAYLSEDRVSVVSEFEVQVSEVLKNNSAAPFSPGDSVDTVRGGGAVRFASGKIIRYGQHGKPLPRTGRRYLFFLKYNGGEKDYSIVTAYELRGGRIFPLDGLNLVGTVEPAYAAYQQYKDADETSFLDSVREAIALNSGGKPKEGGALR